MGTVGYIFARKVAPKYLAQNQYQSDNLETLSIGSMLKLNMYVEAKLCSLCTLAKNVTFVVQVRRINSGRIYVIIKS